MDRATGSRYFARALRASRASMAVTDEVLDPALFLTTRITSSLEHDEYCKCARYQTNSETAYTGTYRRG
jgi:hypothetical protein